MKKLSRELRHLPSPLHVSTIQLTEHLVRQLLGPPCGMISQILGWYSGQDLVVYKSHASIHHGESIEELEKD
jgi:hypothetical protein